MNKLCHSSHSYRKKKASGYRRFVKTYKGRKIIQMRRKKGRQFI